jgi:glycosyltransferase involved in cell wall biosynthesis
MRIGIDAKWLFAGPPSGQRVVRQLVDGLAQVAIDDEIHLFLDRRAAAVLTVPPERQHFVWARNNLLANIALVPRAADRLGLDAVVYQNFVPPRRLARHARVAFVHDAIFASHPEFFSWRERLYFAPLRALTASADRVCTVSASERSRLVRLGFAAAGCVDVVPNAVDPIFMPREAHDATAEGRVRDALDLRGPFVLCVGRLNARKNVSTLVRAMAHVRTPGLRLVVVGAADRTAPPLAAIAERAGVTAAVRWLGDVSDEQLCVLYAAALVLCSLSFDEGFGLPPLEAMAAGAPVIVSRISAHVEVCGDAAVYVEPHEPLAVAAAIDALASDDDARATRRRMGMERASAFTVRRNATALLDAVHTAVAARAPAHELVRA